MEFVLISTRLTTVVGESVTVLSCPANASFYRLILAQKKGIRPWTLDQLICLFINLTITSINTRTNGIAGATHDSDRVNDFCIHLNLQ